MSCERDRKPEPAAPAQHDQPETEAISAERRPVDLAKILASVDRDLDPIDRAPVSAAPGAAPAVLPADKALADAAAASLLLWIERMVRSTESLEQASGLPDRVEATKRVKQLIDAIESDELGPMFIGAMQRTQVDPNQPFDRLLDAYYALEASVATASQKLGAPLQVKRAKHNVDVAVRHFGHRLTRAPQYTPPYFGPHAPAAPEAARTLLAAAIAEAELLERGLDARRYSQVEQRRGEWTDTLDALHAAILELSPEGRRALRRGVTQLQSVFARLLAKERSHHDKVSLYLSTPTLRELKSATR